MSFERSRVTRLSETCRAINRDTRHRHGTGSGSDLLLALCASRRGAKSLPPLVTPQITFNQIPPAAAGGSFNPDLQDTENTLESHRRQPADRSIHTCALNNGKQRLGMNNPPAAAHKRQLTDKRIGT